MMDIHTLIHSMCQDRWDEVKGEHTAVTVQRFRRSRFEGHPRVEYGSKYIIYVPEELKVRIA